MLTKPQAAACHRQGQCRASVGVTVQAIRVIGKLQGPSQSPSLCRWTIPPSLTGTVDTSVKVAKP